VKGSGPVGVAPEVPLAVPWLAGRAVDSRRSITETRRNRLLVCSGPGIDQRPLSTTGSVRARHKISHAI
jgi:hypothetical protein